MDDDVGAAWPGRVVPSRSATWSATWRAARCRARTTSAGATGADWSSTTQNEVTRRAGEREGLHVLPRLDGTRLEIAKLDTTGDGWCRALSTARRLPVRGASGCGCTTAASA